ncbi:tetratricopeptide repeat protein [Rickettsiales endosymbiont of Trichoplax sp. H2]|uniref:tetratricopeptide repeat protein n=1 Tax=Rickettsiales endosymbiont of Trichoplax sp. H2 TaxID=2021221 RepID=UPI0018A7FA41|nr:SEL1-like repeat protein [Rickettsiales endosymbiont of Trichoplax sp. H2]
MKYLSYICAVSIIFYNLICYSDDNKVHEASILIDKCYMHSDEKNYKKAFEYCKKAADMDDANGLYALGMIYAQGLLGEKDYARAEKYFDKAASLDNANVIRSVGSLYFQGYKKKIIKRRLNALKRLLIWVMLMLLIL